MTPNFLNLSPNGKYLLLRTTQAVELWNLGPTGKINAPKLEHTWHSNENITSAAFSADSQRVALLSNGGLTVSLIETATRQSLWGTALPAPALDVILAPDGRHVLTANSNRSIYILRSDR